MSQNSISVCLVRVPIKNMVVDVNSCFLCFVQKEENIQKTECRMGPLHSY